MRIIFQLSLAAVTVSTFLASEAAAQTQGLFGNRGPIGGQQAGGGFGGMQAGGLGMGGMGAPGMGMGAGGMGAPGLGMGAGGMGLGGMGGGMGMGGMGAPGLGMGGAGTPGGFVGRADTQGRFIGEGRTGQQAGVAGRPGAVGTMGGLGGGLGGAAGALRGNEINQANQFGAAGGAASRPVYVRQRIAFAHPERSSATISTSLRGQFNRLGTRAPALRGVQVQLDGNSQVVLRGQVTSEAARKLAEATVRLEPGVRSVRNELTVANQ